MALGACSVLWMREGELSDVQWQALCCYVMRSSDTVAREHSVHDVSRQSSEDMHACVWYYLGQRLVRLYNRTCLG